MNGASSLSLRAFGKAQNTSTSLKMGLGDQNEGPEGPDVYNDATRTTSFRFKTKDLAGGKPLSINKATLGSILDDSSVQPGMGS